MKTLSELRQEMAEKVYLAKTSIDAERLAWAYALVIQEQYQKQNTPIPSVGLTCEGLPSAGLTCEGLPFRGWTKDGSAVYGTLSPKRRLTQTPPNPNHYRVDTELDPILQVIDMDKLPTYRELKNHISQDMPNWDMEKGRRHGE